MDLKELLPRNITYIKHRVRPKTKHSNICEHDGDDNDLENDSKIAKKSTPLMTNLLNKFIQKDRKSDNKISSPQERLGQGQQQQTENSYKFNKKEKEILKNCDIRQLEKEQQHVRFSDNRRISQRVDVDDDEIRRSDGCYLNYHQNHHCEVMLYAKRQRKKVEELNDVLMNEEEMKLNRETEMNTKLNQKNDQLSLLTDRLEDGDIQILELLRQNEMNDIKINDSQNTINKLTSSEIAFKSQIDEEKSQWEITESRLMHQIERMRESIIGSDQGQAEREIEKKNLAFKVQELEKLVQTKEMISRDKIRELQQIIANREKVNEKTTNDFIQAQNQLQIVSHELVTSQNEVQRLVIQGRSLRVPTSKFQDVATRKVTQEDPGQIRGLSKALDSQNLDLNVDSISLNRQEFFRQLSAVTIADEKMKRTNVNLDTSLPYESPRRHSSFSPHFLVNSSQRRLGLNQWKMPPRTNDELTAQKPTNSRDKKYLYTPFFNQNSKETARHNIFNKN